ncbi:MAG TPA: SMI1/KNR4 family protein [Gemmataceae bacterium]|jgi:hypothetical protein
MSESIEQRVKAFWQVNGAMPRPGVTSADLRSFEQRICRALPADVAKFYLCVNGTVETTEWLFEAWPLEKVGSVPDVVTLFKGIPDYSDIADTLPDASEYFAFADCMIWSQVFAVRLGPSSGSTQVVWLSGSSYAVIAPTFDAFWNLYLSDPDAALFATNSVIKSRAG